MKRLRVYAAQAAMEHGRTLGLSREESHHLCTVLRARTGQPLEVFNDAGEAAEARLKVASPRQAVIEITGPMDVVAEPEYRLTLCPALLKEAAWRFVLEKSVELGVAAVIPAVTRYSVPEMPDGPDIEKKRKKWQQTILGAVKQSHRVVVPECGPPVTFDLALERAVAGQAIPLLLYEGEADGPLSAAVTQAADAIRSGRPVWLFVGPEGGFHPDEVHLARQSGAAICGLGPLVQRAETAAIAALATIHASLGTF